MIPDFSKREGYITDYFTEETLNFTYLNSGYIGYAKENSATNDLTSTVCSIYDDKLVFRRYSADGRIGLGADGKHNEKFDDSHLIPREYFAKETESPYAVAIERTKETGIRLEDAKAYVGELTDMHVILKNMEAASYEWSVASSARALLMGEGREITLFGKKEGSTKVTVTVTDVDGNEYSATAEVEFIKKETNNTARTEQLVDGEKYMFVGGSQDISSVRPAITANMKLGNKGDGVRVLSGATVAGLNLNDKTNEVEAKKENLWTVEEGDDGTVALYNEAADKYMHFEAGNKSITLEDEPTYFEVMWSNYDSYYGATGKAVAFHVGRWYLNYSDSQGGFCCYDSSAYDQDGSHFTNQYAVYGPKVDKKTLELAITRAEALNKDIYTAETWTKVNNALIKAKAAEKDAEIEQKDVITATANLFAALEALEAKKVTEAFDDVRSAWYTDYVQYVFENNLMTGVSGTKNFAPTNNITKAQVAQVLYNLEGKPKTEDKSVFTDLTDVSENAWYADPVAWAYSTGIVTGNTTTKTFSPGASVTREQLAAMMYRYAQYKGYDLSKTSDLAGLVNADKVKSYAINAVKWAVGSGYITGSAIGTDANRVEIRDLKPQGSTTRAQMAAILQRFCENNN